jgi:hypothetical protein
MQELWKLITTQGQKWKMECALKTLTSFIKEIKEKYKETKYKELCK